MCILWITRRMRNPKNEIYKYNSHARTQKKRLQRAIPISILWITMRMRNPKNEIPIYRTHARTQKERDPKEAKIGGFSKSFDFFTGSRFFQKHVTFLKAETERMRGAKKRGSLRRPKFACSRRALTFLRDHKAPELPTTLLTRILDFDPTPLP